MSYTKLHVISKALPSLRLSHCRRLQVVNYGKKQNAGVNSATPSESLHTSSETGWTKPNGYDTGLKTFNSLTKRKEPLILAKEGVASWYSCGPTVYDHAHLGHACSYVRFDIIHRILSRVFGINVVHVMVITDIDDKIIKRARESNISPVVLARMYEEEFKNDMTALKVLPPMVYMRVTQNMPQIISFIQGIMDNGHAYVTCKGNVYFDIRSIGNRYGKLAGLAEAVEEAGDGDKREARDFALWKSSKPHEPSWNSPWGRGRPGWHIECSTIASSVFGGQLDVHSGGIDLAFPHHENEMAQCEAYHQCSQWGNYFLHSGHLHLKGSTEKMSKSLKNYITIKEFLRSYSADEFRMFCLLSRYRSAVDYSDASMTVARSTLSSISAFCHDAEAYIRGQLVCQPVDETELWGRLAHTQATVRTSLADDFDTPCAMDALMTLIYHGNRQLQTVAKTEGLPRSPAVFGAVISYLKDILDKLGIDAVDRKAVLAVKCSGTLQNVVEQLVRFRSEVRSFALLRQAATRDTTDTSHMAAPSPCPDGELLLKACDTLRTDLAPLGILIKDRGAHSTWEICRPHPERAGEEGTAEGES